MQFLDITHDHQKTYRLGENEQVVFLMENRDGTIAFELSGPKAEAHVFAFYSESGTASSAPDIVVRHLAPDTVSRTVVRARLSGSASLRFRGRIRIVQDAVRSDARQDVRALLLSTDARASAAPELEIDTDDVVCSHAASIAPPDAEQLASLAMRGLSEAQATALLADGFFKDARERIKKYES